MKQIKTKQIGILFIMLFLVAAILLSGLCIRDRLAFADSNGKKASEDWGILKDDHAAGVMPTEDDISEISPEEKYANLEVDEASTLKVASSSQEIINSILSDGLFLVNGTITVEN